MDGYSLTKADLLKEVATRITVYSCTIFNENYSDRSFHVPEDGQHNHFTDAALVIFSLTGKSVCFYSVDNHFNSGS